MRIKLKSIRKYINNDIIELNMYVQNIQNLYYAKIVINQNLIN